MIEYRKMSNGKTFASNNTRVIDILTNEELTKKIESQNFFQRLFKPIKVI